MNKYKSRYKVNYNVKNYLTKDVYKEQDIFMNIIGWGKYKEVINRSSKYL
ncbi:hypothetical protein [Spiroplasma apis]|uniref:Uncharacterized protein n=1 Tax=Spiroplasma apis B31 TaxID=1276258 RepID=V5RID8_SPIAP|nr:hypothetical protein [Spiroplasma apis]AHB36452.1 hypothetical protein SAPIS_v1c06070 [Spiroplasma apis B31]